jgi:hypothetical protein
LIIIAPSVCIFIVNENDILEYIHDVEKKKDSFA